MASLRSTARFSNLSLVSELCRRLPYLFPFYGVWQAVGSEQSDLPPRFFFYPAEAPPHNDAWRACRVHKLVAPPAAAATAATRATRVGPWQAGDGFWPVSEKL